MYYQSIHNKATLTTNIPHLHIQQNATDELTVISNLLFISKLYAVVDLVHCLIVCFLILYYFPESSGKRKRIGTNGLVSMMTTCIYTELRHDLISVINTFAPTVFQNQSHSAPNPPASGLPHSLPLLLLLGRMQQSPALKLIINQSIYKLSRLSVNMLAICQSFQGIHHKVLIPYVHLHVVAIFNERFQKIGIKHPSF